MIVLSTMDANQATKGTEVPVQEEISRRGRLVTILVQVMTGEGLTKKMISYFLHWYK